jgi:tRNA (cytidine/uridine-2'-O-)-methyltransferase
MRVILYQPQIPQNTGNIVRTCSVTGSSLTLVKPLGFSVSNRWLKRAGLDYWEGVDISLIDDLEQFLDASNAPFYLFSSKAKRVYTEVPYAKDSLLIFGSETEGLPPHFFEKWAERSVTLPMQKGSRCLN